METKQHCYSITEILRYLQNKMSRKEETQFQHHLLECEHCKETTNRLRDMIGELGYGGKKKVITYVVAATMAMLTIGGGTILMLKQDGQDAAGVPSKEIRYDDAPFHNSKDSVNDTIKNDSIKILIPKKK